MSDLGSVVAAINQIGDAAVTTASKILSAISTVEKAKAAATKGRVAQNNTGGMQDNTVDPQNGKGSGDLGGQNIMGALTNYAGGQR